MNTHDREVSSDAAPSTLSQVRDAIFARLAHVLEGSDFKPRDVATASQREGTLFVKLNVRELPKRDVQVEFDDDRLTFKRRSHESYVDLERFYTRTLVRRYWLVIELRRRPPVGGRELSLPAALPAAAEIRAALVKASDSTRAEMSAIFVCRGIKAVTKLSEEVPEKSLAEAVAASTDYRVLLRALAAPEVGEALKHGDPLAMARVRGLENRQRFLEDSYSSEQVARLLGMSRQAVDERRKRGKLIGLTRGKRGYAYPAWQFDDGAALLGLEKILDVLRGHDPWMQSTFMLNRNERLDGKSPVEVLRHGEIESVQEAARAFGEHGAA
jgi:hypothetical protein